MIDVYMWTSPSQEKLNKSNVHQFFKISPFWSERWSLFASNPGLWHLQQVSIGSIAIRPAGNKGSLDSTKQGKARHKITNHNIFFWDFFLGGVEIDKTLNSKGMEKGWMFVWFYCLSLWICLKKLLSLLLFLLVIGSQKYPINFQLQKGRCHDGLLISSTNFKHTYEQTGTKPWQDIPLHWFVQKGSWFHGLNKKT